LYIMIFLDLLVQISAPMDLKEPILSFQNNYLVMLHYGSHCKYLNKL